MLQSRGYKSWNKDGLGEEKMLQAMLLVLADEPVSARNACKQIFGEKFPNVHRTLGNLYKSRFGESIGLARKLSIAKRRERRKQLEECSVELPHVGNPTWQPYLTPDEEKLVCSFLQTCNFMHLPFNRDAFKVVCLGKLGFVLVLVCFVSLLTKNFVVILCRGSSAPSSWRTEDTPTQLQQTFMCDPSLPGTPSSPSSKRPTWVITGQNRLRRRCETRYLENCRYVRSHNTHTFTPLLSFAHTSYACMCRLCWTGWSRPT